MKKILPILFFALGTLSLLYGQAQQNGIRKAQAFYRQSIAGNIPVDDNGVPMSNGVHRDYLIYLETRGTTLPQWKTAYIDGMPYTIRAVEVKQAVDLGKAKGKSTNVVIKKETGNRLWQLMVTPDPHAQPATTSSPTPSLTLSGTYRGKAFTHRIAKMQELAKQFNP